MNIKKLIIAILLVLIVLTALSFLLMSILNFPRMRLIFFTVHFVLYVYTIIFCVFFWIVSIGVWTLIPQTTKDRLALNKERYHTVSFISLLLLILLLWISNHYLYDYSFGLSSLLGGLGITLLALSVAFTILSPQKRKPTHLLWAAFLILLLVISSIVTLGPSDSREGERGKILATPLQNASVAPTGKTTSYRGVTIYNPAKAYKGLNLYSHLETPRSFLMDMQGQVVHTWNPNPALKKNVKWYHIELTREGDLIMLSPKLKMMHVALNSEIKWVNHSHFHHDLDIADNGDIYSVSHQFEQAWFSVTPLPIGNQYLTVLSPDGKIKKKVSLYKIFKDRIPPDKISHLRRWLFSPRAYLNRLEELLIPPRRVDGAPTNILHCNSVEIIRKDLNEHFRKGRLLLSLRHLDLVGVIDLEEERLIWDWGQGQLEKPHHPTLLENGNILIFDNGNDRKYTRIVELNPVSRQIVWEYKADPPESFYTSWGGSNQRLPNGNTLIVDTGEGRAFEVTKEGEVVWEFYNPNVKPGNKERSSIYRMMRITDEDAYPFLRKILDRPR